MSRSRHQGRCGRGCGVCGDAGETRHAREGAWRDADERTDPDPHDILKTDDAIDRADEPCGISPRCDRERCMRWRPCAACALAGDV